VVESDRKLQRFKKRRENWSFLVSFVLQRKEMENNSMKSGVMVLLNKLKSNFFPYFNFSLLFYF